MCENFVTILLVALELKVRTDAQVIRLCVTFLHVK